jgi:hypothetical protein
MNLVRFGGPVAIGAAIGMGIWKTIQSAAQAPFTVQAAVGEAVGAHLAATRGFDPRYLMGMGLIESDPAKLAAARRMSYLSTGFSVLRGATNIGAWIAGENPALAAGDVAFANAAREAAEAEAAKDPDVAQRMGVLTGAAIQRLQHRRRFGKQSYQNAADVARDRKVEFSTLLGGQAAMASAGLGAWAAGSRGYTNAFASMIEQGMDPGDAAAIIGTAAQGGVQGLGGDPVIRGMLGRAAAGFMGPAGMTAAGGAGLADMLTAGVGAGPRGFRAAQQNIMGVQARGSLMGGFDPYQQSFNLATATSLMPGASPYAQNLLATQMADPNTLGAIMSGRLPRGMAAMGINLQTAQAQAAAVGGSLVNRWVDTGGGSRSEQLMRQVRDQYGGDFGKFMRAQRDKEGAVEDLAPMLAGITGWDIGTSMGFLRTAAGRAPTRRGGRPGDAADAADDYAKAMISTTADLHDFSTKTKVAGDKAERFGKAIEGATTKLNKALGGETRTVLGVDLGPRSDTGGGGGPVPSPVTP